MGLNTKDSGQMMGTGKEKENAYSIIMITMRAIGFTGFQIY